MSRAIKNRLEKLEQTPIWATGFESFTDAELDAALRGELSVMFAASSDKCAFTNETVDALRVMAGWGYEEAVALLARTA